MQNLFTINAVFLVFGLAIGLYLPIMLSYLLIIKKRFGLRLLWEILARIVLICIGLFLLFIPLAIVSNQFGPVNTWVGYGEVSGFVAGTVIALVRIVRVIRRRTTTDTSEPAVQDEKNLIPLAAYDADETGYWRRVPLVAGLFFGVWMAVFAALFPLNDSNLLYSRLTRVLINLIGGGLVFGLLFPFLFRRWVMFLQSALYAGKSWIDVSPPTNKRLEYRLMCQLKTDRRSTIGGIMHLGLDGLIFVPHKRNRRNAEVVEIGPLSALKISIADPPAPVGIQRILIPHPQPVLEVQWPGGRATFIVPSIPSTATRLSDRIKMLKAEEV